jgi:hypothetical protein
VPADDLSIVEGPRGIENAYEMSDPNRSARNRRRRVRFQVAHARGDGSPWRGQVRFGWTLWWVMFVGGHGVAAHFLYRCTGRISAGLH